MPVSLLHKHVEICVGSNPHICSHHSAVAHGIPPNLVRLPCAILSEDRDLDDGIKQIVLHKRRMAKVPDVSIFRGDTNFEEILTGTQEPFEELETAEENRCKGQSPTHLHFATTSIFDSQI